MSKFKDFFSRKRKPSPDEWAQIKAREMEKFFGRTHDIVRHSDLPFSAGGFLDLYYHPNWEGGGTAITTRELINEDGSGNGNEIYDAYELVMFTRHALDLENAFNAQTPFGRIHRQINSILNAVARFGGQAVFNPFETATLPPQMPEVGGHHLLFGTWEGLSEEIAFELPCAGKFGIMHVTQLHPSEIQFLREKGVPPLFELLVEHEAWPYADLDREPVV
jgi:hypothetical protein